MKLCIMHSSISEEVLLEICRACPLLKELSAEREVRISEPVKSHMLEFATELSRACPLLEDVSIPKDSSFSKAETYSMHFPQTFTLEFNDSGISGYEPSRLDQIEASAQCVGVKHLSLRGCRVSSTLGGATPAVASTQSRCALEPCWRNAYSTRDYSPMCASALKYSRI